MFSKQEIAEAYRLDEHGIVCSPGKFEGEPWYVVALWELVLNGCADSEIFDGDDLISVFTLDKDLRDACGLETPRRDGADHIVLWERSDGFVCSRQLSTTQLHGLETECDAGDAGDAS